MPAPALTHAARLVRDFDRERFVTALFAPAERREALMVLYAFNTEIARVQESVREPMAGMIRLQWWRDTLIAGAEGALLDHHPVARPLGELIRSHDLGLDLFEDLISSREADLEGGQPSDMDALCRYAERSSAALSQLAARILGAEDDESLLAAGEVGVAWGLIGNLRALAHRLSIGKLTIPAKSLDEAGLSAVELRGHPGLRPIVREVGERARTLLAQARRRRPARAALAALLPAILADGYLNTLENQGWDAFHPTITRRRSRPVRLFFAHLLGQY